MQKKKHFGQHFLHDQNILRQLVNFINPKPSDNIVEIGPGAGALTSQILPLVNQMDAIEVDQDVIPELKRNVEYSKKLHLHISDVLQFDFNKLPKPQRFIGNLPYNISTPLLFLLIKNIGYIKDMHFMLQKEVADRIVATPGTKTYGRLSVMLQYYCEVKLLLRIGSGAFVPAPKVDSAFIRLTPRTSYNVKAICQEKFSAIARDAFNHRRKFISNSMKAYVSPEDLRSIDIDPQLRPEELVVAEFVKIENLVSSRGKDR